MSLRHNQRGMSIFNLMYILITLAIFGYIGLKLFPAYTENIKIERAIKAVVAQADSAKKPSDKVVADIVKRLDIDSVTLITERNWKQYLTMERKRAGLVITVDYAAEVPLFFNLSLIAKFNFIARPA